MQVLTRPPSGMPALVLNADFRPLSYYPLSLWPWQEVIKAVFLDRVDVVASYDQVVHSPSFEMRLPSVVALKQYVPQERPPAFTRFNLFLRDAFSCQYCGSTEDLTFDHVIPRSRGVGPLGRTSSPPARRAISARAVVRRGRRGCSPTTTRAGPRCTSYRSGDGGSRRAGCMSAGWTICTGTSSWKPEAPVGAPMQPEPWRQGFIFRGSSHRRQAMTRPDTNKDEDRHFTHGTSASTADMAAEGEIRPEDKSFDAPTITDCP